MSPYKRSETFDDKLAAAQKRLDQRRRAYRLARRTDTTRYSHIEPSFMFRASVAILAFLLAAVVCMALMSP